MGPKAASAEPTGAARFGRVKANLRMGIVGLPNVGKSSLFNLLTEQSAAAENYPFCTVEPNIARCPVPDQRYDWLCEVWQPPSTYPAYLNLTDIAGLIRGASEGAGLGNAFLSHIQAVDGIFHCVRAFESEEVTHVDDSVDPCRDLDTIQSELCKKDMAYVAAQREARERDCKKTPNAKLPPLFYSTLDKVEAMLADNIPVRTGDWTAPEVEKINELIPQCITTKPLVYLVNLSQKAFVSKKSKWLPKIAEWVAAHGGGTIIPFSVEFEQALWDFNDDEDGRAAFLATCGAGVKSVLPRMVKVGYRVLQLIYFFTAGETEVRCWTIPQGALAPQAAGAIHSDFERGFIKAEVVSFADFKELADGKSMAAIKAAGKYRQEGKQYVVADGDIIHFQFNVTTKKK
ncbi:P-loop containing nucleoside triphosphate hydrolase protein [Tribonema minus]|uniref:Obg-like ATPase homolog n=1 Tax=Tribonema minus TaxID=303371 RepID=A0A836CAC2_9STRA|nr:P-loop containing nucleoside triphosphate hydrolase protein [Tribonema minus]